jgi:GT2 family glycosyltransferase
MIMAMPSPITSGTGVKVAWVLLTMGDRPAALREAVSSIESVGDVAPNVTVVSNGGPECLSGLDGVRVIHLPENVGIPAARHIAMERLDADIVFFLDDDARVEPGVERAVIEAFAADEKLGAVSVRIIDEHGQTARRHVPRVGSASGPRSGLVATFLGGACAIRRSVYLDVGGYWGLLWYGHEELDLSWRLIDAGYSIRYLAEVRVVHPLTDISRHADGWRLTGRNRVLVARRNLPAPVLIVHTLVWLIAGWFRARRAECGAAYLAGWREGWRISIERRPVRWRTVWRLARLGRPPLV